VAITGGAVWNFGDGTPNSILNSPYHCFTKPGTFNAF
jgi:hypothetical protein